MSKPQERKIFTIESSQEDLERIKSLFESEELSNLLGIEILDVGLIFEEPNQAAFSRSLSDSTKHKNGLLRNLLSNIFEGELKPAFRNTNSAVGIKQVQLRSPIELIIGIERLPEEKMQISLRVRPSDGKGFLPSGLKVILKDEIGEVLLEKEASNETNLLEVTKGGRLTCQLNDYFIVQLTLGDESVVEKFII